MASCIKWRIHMKLPPAEFINNRLLRWWNCETKLQPKVRKFHMTGGNSVKINTAEDREKGKLRVWVCSIKTWIGSSYMTVAYHSHFTAPGRFRVQDREIKRGRCLRSQFMPSFLAPNNKYPCNLLRCCFVQLVLHRHQGADIRSLSAWDEQGLVEWVREYRPSLDSDDNK